MRNLQDPEDERPPSLARGEGSREAPGAEEREAAWSRRRRAPQEELAALPENLHEEEQEKEHLLLQLPGQLSPLLGSDMKEKPYDYTDPSARKTVPDGLQPRFSQVGGMFKSITTTVQSSKALGPGASGASIRAARPCGQGR